MDYLFGTGLSRSGGALYSSVMSAHSEVEMACCPNLEFFKYLRTSAALTVSSGNLQIGVQEPLPDWYFRPELEELFGFLMKDLSLNLDFPASERSDFISSSRSRGSLESPDIAQHFSELQGSTYADILMETLDLIMKVRGSNDTRYVGFHETWIIDFFPVLARAFPEAKFIVMLRDPRAIINSVKGIRKQHPDQVVDIVSYARHWRKYVSLARRFLRDPLFDGRLVISSHDAIMNNPTQEFTAITQTLEIDFDPEMLNHSNFTNPHTSATWQGNSSFDAVITDFSPSRSNRWRDSMGLNAVALIEYFCGAEMPLVGFDPVTVFATPDADQPAWLRQELSADVESFSNWRSHNGDSASIMSAEANRRSILMNPTQLESSQIFENFLLSEAYIDIRAIWHIEE